MRDDPGLREAIDEAVHRRLMVTDYGYASQFRPTEDVYCVVGRHWTSDEDAARVHGAWVCCDHAPWPEPIVGCTNVEHDSVDCTQAVIPVDRWCETCRRTVARAYGETDA